MKRLFFIAFFLTSMGAHAQLSNIAGAVKHLQAGNLDSAKLLIDDASVNSGTAENAKTWYYRGYIYKEIYKKLETKDPSSKAREIALNSFKLSLQLDTAKNLEKDNRANIKYLAIQYYNDAATILNEDTYEIAIRNFEIYKEAMAIAVPDIDLKQQDIQFKLAVATIFMSMYEADSGTDEVLFEAIKSIYENILKEDPENVSANYNMGILHYNKAVLLINSLDYAIELEQLSLIQDNSIVLFKQSLPYMQHAIDVDPTNINTLTGLAGIYFSLNEFEKSEAIKLKIEEIKKDQ